MIRHDCSYIHLADLSEKRDPRANRPEEAKDDEDDNQVGCDGAECRGNGVMMDEVLQPSILRVDDEAGLVYLEGKGTYAFPGAVWVFKYIQQTSTKRLSTEILAPATMTR